MMLDQSQLAERTSAQFTTRNCSGMTIEPVAQGGSGRHYFRLEFDDETPPIILMSYGNDRAENDSFIPVTEYLSQLNVAVPQILAKDRESRLVWLEDLGRRDLYSLRNLEWHELRPYYRNALGEVRKLHAVADNQQPPFPLQPTFNESIYSWEQNYFFDNFLGRFCKVADKDLERLRHDPQLKDLGDYLGNLPRFLVHRDFQSQNIMIRDGKTVLIDYQGLRWGRPEYDLASLLYDPYAELDRPMREELLRFYHQTFEPERCSKAFYKLFLQCAAQRLMQALGAYGYLGVKLDKIKFLGYIPAANALLREVLQELKISPPLVEALKGD